MNKSTLQEEEKVETPFYEEKDENYVRNLQKRIESAKLNRDKPREEFDGMTYEQYYDTNVSGANTYIKAKKNKADTVFQSGTLRGKMMSLLATLVGLNLKSDILAYNQNDFPIQSLGNAMEDVMEKTKEMENDEEKQMLRQYELLSQGTVFVEDVWYEDTEIEKKIKKGFYGQRKKVEWTRREKKSLGSPKRSIIPGKAVYLGDMSEYNIENQPYIYTVQLKDYDKAEKIFGKWEMWKYVTKTRTSFTGQMLENSWRLLDEDKEKVEIIRYEDPVNNEFQIIINGIIMLPIGFPLTEISPDGYTVAQQNLEPIKPNFAYGKSFIFKNKNLVAVLDQMMKLAVLKTWKSFMPPYLNLSGRVISKDIFMPAKITRGIGRGDIAPLSDNETQGVTAGENNMIQEVIKFIDKNTVSQTFGGGKEQGGNVTATQIMELQRQSRIMLGILILSASLLEKKLDTKRLGILLVNWFNPVGNVLDNGELKNKYRIVSRLKDIGKEGMGLRLVIPMGKIPTKEAIKVEEEKLSLKHGKPVKILVLNPHRLKKMKIVWYISVNAKEKRSSEYTKMTFDEMLIRGMNLGLPFDPVYLQQRFATMWEEDPSKMFLKGGAPMMPAQEGQKQQTGNIGSAASQSSPPGQGSMMQRAQR